MSDKNFMSYGDAEPLFAELGSELEKRIEQYSTMPSASSTLLNKIVQYIGTTSGNYINGLFYKCVYNAVEEDYEWIKIDMSGGNGIAITATLLASGWDANNQQTIIFDGYSSSMNGVIGVPASATSAQKTAYTEAIINVVNQVGNSFTFEATNVPSINLPVVVYAGGGSGSGGTNVEPNPEGTPTDELVTIRIEDDIYSLAGGCEAIEKTQAQYNALTETEKLDPKKVYYITDAGGGSADPSLHFDWSNQTLPQTGDTNTIYCIPTGDTSDPWDFYAWNDTDQEFVKIDFNMTINIDSALSDISTNPVQNRVVKGAIDVKADNTQTFTEASTRANIASGETFQTILGKVKKFFTDLGTAAFKDIPASGDASITEVVMGNDTRLSDSRSASDVYDWAKAATKPNYIASEVGALASDGTAVRATADADGNTISSTYMKKGVDYVTAGQKSGTTLGANATAEGTSTIASSANQHVEGKYNVEDTNGTYAHIIGGGTADNDRKNIFTVDWNGDVSAGRSNGLTDDTKLPTGADVIDYLDSNMSNSKSINGNPVVISDAANAYAEEVITNIEPIQDLHGYDHPWVGGAGKNQAYDVTYISAKNQYAPMIKTSYKLKQGKRYVISFYTVNTNIVIYREAPTVLGFDSLSVYSFDCDGTRKSMYGTATADATISNVDIIKRLSSTSDVESGLCYDLQIEEVADTVTTPTDYAPYSNICPISGLDSVEVKRTGKNLLPMTVDGIKAINTNGIWSGNAYTLNGVTFTLLTDTNDNIVGFSINGTATANTNLFVGTANIEENYIVNGCPTGGSYNSSYSIWAISNSPYEEAVDAGNGVAITEYYQRSIRVRIANGYTANNLIFRPMIRLSTETDSTFEPYQSETHTTSLPQTTYGGTLNVQTGELVVNKRYNIIDGSKVTSVSVNSATDTMGGKRLISTITDAKPTMGTVTPNIISDKLHVVTPDNIYSTDIPNVVSINDIGQVVLRYQGASTLADAQTVLNNSPIQVAYELATSQTYQLTSQQVKLLLNHNNISTNANEISVKYQPNNNLGEILTVSEEYTDRKVKEEVKSFKDASGNPIIIEDSANAYANKVIANINSIQDLHGYNHPWVGGAGKNVQPLTIDGIKSVNTSATWTGNSITLSGVTFTIQTDSDNNVIGILANGDTTISSGDFVALNLPHPATLTGNYIINGCPAGGGADTYIQRIGRTASSVYYGQELGSGLALNNVNDIFTISIFVKHASNIVFKPMIRLAAEADSSFAPYSNICPISGLDSVEVKRIGKNLFDIIKGYTSARVTISNDEYITIPQDPSVGWDIIGSFEARANVLYTISVTSGYSTAKSRIAFGSTTSTTPSAGDVSTLAKGTFSAGNAVEVVNVNRLENVFTSSKDQIVYIWNCTDRTGTSAQSTFTIQIEEGTTATTFEPYQLETHTMSLPQTTYGGTLNVQTGELVVDRGYLVVDGSETFDMVALSDYGYMTFRTSSRASEIQNFNYIWNNPTGYFLNNMFVGTDRHGDNVYYARTADFALDTNNGFIYLCVPKSLAADVTSFKAFLSANNFQLVRELITPQTYHLTPEQVKLLKGFNYITTNADTLDITYQVDNVLGEILEESEEYTDRTFDSYLNSNLALFKNSKVIPSSSMVTSLTVNAEASYFTLMLIYFCNGVGSGICTFNCHNGQLLQKTDIMRGESNIPFNVTFDTAKKAIITPKNGDVFHGTILASCNIT